jgi:mRNA interferase MazF
MPPAPVSRGEVWLTDLGMAAKVRPCLVLSVAPGPADRVLFTLVPHTTTIQGTAFEISVPVRFLKPGAFDAQGLVTVPRPRMLRRLGTLSPSELAPVETVVRAWLRL